MGIFKSVTIAVAVLALALYALQKPLSTCYEIVPSDVRLALRLMPYMSLPFSILEKLGIMSEVEFLRASMESATQIAPETDALRIENTHFDGVPVRVYFPKDSQSNGAAIFYIHGGGWVLGSVNSYDPITRAFALQLNMVTVSVDYRRAPDAAYPAAIDDVDKAFRYFASHAADYKVDPSRIAVAGDSAGGNLAASLTVRMQDAALKSPGAVNPLPKAQILLYPVMQSANYSTVSMLVNMHDLLLPRTGMRTFVLQYALGMDFYNATLRSLAEEYVDQGCLRLKHTQMDAVFQSNKGDIRERILTDADRKFLNSLETNSELTQERKLHEQKCTMEQASLNELHSRMECVLNPDFSPLFSTSVKNTPPTFILSCAFDVLRDDSLLYIERLRDAGVFLEHVHKPHLCHGYFSFVADESVREVTDFVKKNKFL